MSLNWITGNSEKVEWMNINAKSVKCDEFEAKGDVVLGGNNFNNLGLGANGQHITTDGAGNLSWEPVLAGGGGDVSYTDISPTAINNISLYNSTDGKQLKASGVSVNDIVLKDGTIAMDKLKLLGNIEDDDNNPILLQSGTDIILKNGLVASPSIICGNGGDVEVTGGNLTSRLRVDATGYYLFDNSNTQTQSSHNGNLILKGLTSFGNAFNSRYHFPEVRGNNNDTLITNGSGVVVWKQITDVGSLDSGSITSNFGTINNGNSSITTTGQITGGNVIANNITINDGGGLGLGNTSSPANMRCIHMHLVSSNNLVSGRVLKIIDVGGIAKVDYIQATDPNSTTVIGISMEDKAVDLDIKVCVGGIWNAVVQNGHSIAIGSKVKKSDVIGQEGRIVSSGVAVGSFGVALTSGTGNIGGTVKIRGLFTKNEIF